MKRERKKQKCYETRHTPLSLWVRKNGGMQATSDILGCSLSAVCRWIMGNRIPVPLMAMKIVKASRGAVTLEDLYRKA